MQSSYKKENFSQQHILQLLSHFDLLYFQFLENGMWNAQEFCSMKNLEVLASTIHQRTKVNTFIDSETLPLLALHGLNSSGMT